MERPDIEEFLENEKSLKGAARVLYLGEHAESIATYALMMEKALDVLAEKVGCIYDICPAASVNLEQRISCNECVKQYALQQAQQEAVER